MRRVPPFRGELGRLGRSTPHGQRRRLPSSDTKESHDGGDSVVAPEQPFLWTRPDIDRTGLGFFAVTTPAVFTASASMDVPQTRDTGRPNRTREQYRKLQH